MFSKDMNLTTVFDCVDSFPLYRNKSNTSVRLNLRHRFLIEPFIENIQDALVLDLAAHDGRWSYAFAAAGARKVVGIEGREELIKEFRHYPDEAIKKKVSLHAGDIFAGVRYVHEAKLTFNVVALFGIFYHIMDHMHLLREVLKLKPELIIIDSLFHQADYNMIMLVREETTNVLNATPKERSQNVDLTGVPSYKAMETMADILDCDFMWLDWSVVPKKYQKYVREYFQAGKTRRRTCALFPRY